MMYFETKNGCTWLTSQRWNLIKKLQNMKWEIYTPEDIQKTDVL